MKRLVWIGSFSYLLMGFAHVVIGAIMPELLQYYSLDYSDGGRLVFLQFLGYLTGVLLTPYGAKRYGSKTFMVLVLSMLGAAELVYSSLPSWPLMLAAAPFAGFGFGAIEAIVGALIIEHVQERPAVAMSRLEVSFGVGAISMPVIASILYAAGMWRLSFLLIVLLCAGMIVIWMRMSFHSLDRHLGKRAGAETGEAIQRQRRPYSPPQRIVLIGMVLFFLLYLGLETSIVNFMPSILIERVAASHAAATISVTLFWSTAIVGRVFCGVIAERIGYGRYLIWSCAGTIICLSGFAVSNRLWFSYAAVFMIGLAIAGIFAVGLLFANRIIPGMALRTTSILIAAGGLGGAVIPLWLGWSMDRFAVDRSLGILVALSVLMLLVILITARFSSLLRVKHGISEENLHGQME